VFENNIHERTFPANQRLQMMRMGGAICINRRFVFGSISLMNSFKHHRFA